MLRVVKLCIIFSYLRIPYEDVSGGYLSLLVAGIGRLGGYFVWWSGGGVVVGYVSGRGLGGALICIDKYRRGCLRALGSAYSSLRAATRACVRPAPRARRAVLWLR